mmetsp:Transcript_28245/g.72017  ORF Transcript_28245/g.72017 Transcript_28245/m.72017 type:complete len:354 (-) Transcript_28245:307-1368(-)
MALAIAGAPSQLHHEHVNPVMAAISTEHSAAPSPQGVVVDQGPLHLLSQAFSQFNEALDHSVSEPTLDGFKRRIQALETEWHARGLSGRQALSLVQHLRVHVAWESMMPEQFSRFYRFLFHILKEPQRKHVLLDVASEAWELVLYGRFRLLDKWREFIQTKRDMLRVINEDQWRQVLDFSRTVHEDLSNFDANGAWAWILDDFVEHLRSERPSSRAQSMDADMSSCMESSLTSRMVPMSPRCGSKRRSPDIDTVAQQLSACPLPSAAPLEDSGLASATKRQCTTEYQLRPGYGVPGVLPGQGPQQQLPEAGPGQVLFELPMLALPQRRQVRTRRSGVSDLVSRTVTDALGLNE